MKTPQVCRPHPSLPYQTSEEGGEHLEKDFGQNSKSAFHRPQTSKHDRCLQKYEWKARSPHPGEGNSLPNCLGAVLVELLEVVLLPAEAEGPRFLDFSQTWRPGD